MANRMQWTRRRSAISLIEVVIGLALVAGVVLAAGEILTTAARIQVVDEHILTVWQTIERIESVVGLPPLSVSGNRLMANGYRWEYDKLSGTPPTGVLRQVADSSKTGTSGGLIILAAQFDTVKMKALSPAAAQIIFQFSDGIQVSGVVSSASNR